MSDVIGPIIIGIFLIILGILNRKGNISSIHRYHRHRVSEEDRIPFGKMVGAGTLVIGISLMLFGGFAFAANKFDNDIFSIIGSVVVIAGLVTGCALSFYAMIKYNKGIF